MNEQAKIFIIDQILKNGKVGHVSVKNDVADLIRASEVRELVRELQ